MTFRAFFVASELGATCGASRGMRSNAVQSVKESRVVVPLIHIPVVESGDCERRAAP